MAHKETKLKAGRGQTEMRVDVRRSVRHTYADTHACPLAHFPTLYQIWKKERR
jgi:hypothetical protein